MVVEATELVFEEAVVLVEAIELVERVVGLGLLAVLVVATFEVDELAVFDWVLVIAVALDVITGGVGTPGQT